MQIVPTIPLPIARFVHDALIELVPCPLLIVIPVGTVQIYCAPAIDGTL
jgi:hypothetical protein